VFTGPLNEPKILKGKFRENTSYSHLKHLLAIKRREILYSSFQKKGASYDPENTVMFKSESQHLSEIYHAHS
jgi:hypothetical protein